MAGVTAQRGYGYRHQQIRRALLAVWQPGDKCTRCHEPMWGPPESIHLGHTDDRSGYRGLEHASCNTADGARRGNRQRPRFIIAASPAVKPQCKVCGKTYHYAARMCSVCASHYHPTHRAQRSCSRACGVLLRRMSHVPVPRPERTPAPAPVKTERACEFCGKRFMAYAARYCTNNCGTLARYYAKRTTGQPMKSAAESAARRQSRKW